MVEGKLLNGRVTIQISMYDAADLLAFLHKYQNTWLTDKRIKDKPKVIIQELINLLEKEVGESPHSLYWLRFG